VWLEKVAAFSSNSDRGRGEAVEIVGARRLSWVELFPGSGWLPDHPVGRRAAALWEAGSVAARPPDATGAFDRDRALRRLSDETFDVLVVGGGVTGAGVALDAAARGLRTALVERHDFASGTSSKSSKMVHGGLRYLQQGDVRLVYEALRERQRLLHNAPHLVTPLPFLIPLFGRDGMVSTGVARAIATALWLYDLTGGWRIGRRHQRVTSDEALTCLPTLRTDRLVAGFLYFDARVDDARLTLGLARTAAVDFGAAVANYAEVVALRRDDRDTVTGAVVRPCGPRESGSERTFAVRARVVVNATGVWADDIRALDEGVHPRTTRPAKGVHVTVPRDRLPANTAAVLPVPGDRRTVFVVPWSDSDDTYIGTTDTAWDGELDEPLCTADDVDYLLGAVNAATTTVISRADITGVWAGLRPLLAPPSSPAAGTTSPDNPSPDSASRGSASRGSASRGSASRTGGVENDGNAPVGDRPIRPGRHTRSWKWRQRSSDRTADLSRRHRVMTSHTGVVTVTGGKLTTYRLMAEDTVDEVVRQLGALAPPGVRRSPTRRLKLRGAPPQHRARGDRTDDTTSGFDGRAATSATRQAPSGFDGGTATSATRQAPSGFDGRTATSATREAPVASDASGADPDHVVEDPVVRAALHARYGTELPEVLALADGHRELLTRLVPGLPYLRVEVLWAAGQEMAQSIDDVLARRMRVTLRRAQAAADLAGEVGELLGSVDGRAGPDLTAEATAFAKGVLDELARAGIPTDPAAPTRLPTTETILPHTPNPSADTGDSPR